MRQGQAALLLAWRVYVVHTELLQDWLHLLIAEEAFKTCVA